MRNICASFIIASAFAYFGGVFLVFLGYPPILNQPPVFQLIAFVIMGIFSLFAISPGKSDPIQLFRLILAVVWGAMSAFTFVGFVQWAPDGSAPYQLFMTIWDLLLAVAVLDNGGA